MNEAALRATACAWFANVQPAVVVQVQSHRGSVPREAGTRMLVSVDQVLGTIGGGHLELQAIDKARALLQQGPAAKPVEQALSLGPSLGQCCGGALQLRYAPLAQDNPAAWAPIPPRFSLQLYGAGHVGRAIVRLLQELPCQVTWIDERESEFPTAPLPPHIQVVCADSVQAEVARAQPGDYFLVLTHSHELDLAITLAVMQRGDFGFFGLIGSKSKRARFEHRLLERGIHASLLRRLHCPIGLSGVVGKEPAVLALAVVAQLLQVSMAPTFCGNVMVQNVDAVPIGGSSLAR